MRERLPRLLQVALAAGTLASALALSGCAPSASAPTPTVASPSATAFFASDEEALAAATAAYDAYLKVSDEVAAKGGLDPSPLQDVVTSDEYARQTATFETYRARALHASGATTTDSWRLERADPATGDVTAYLCVDVSKVRVLDSSGADQTPPERPERLPIEAGFELVDGHLRMARSAVWSGDNFC
jgi:hypothetical protein